MIKDLWDRVNRWITKEMPVGKVRLFTLVLLAVTAAAAGLYWGLTSWYQPLDAPLALATSTASAVPDTAAPGEQATPTPEEGGTPTIQPVCGGPPSMTILVSGVASEKYLYGLADAVRVVRVDFQNQQVSALALPRDLWVEIPSIGDHGISQGKLNQAYFYGTEGMGYYDGGGAGSGLLAETLQTNYGLRADHYLAVNLNSFEMIIDAMGGIDVYLPQDVYRKQFGEPELYLKAGSHHLNGKQAEMLARQRIEIGDFGRINNQTIILKAVAAKLLTPSGMGSLPNLVNRLRDNVLTDLSPSQVSQLLCLAGKIDPGADIQFESLPQEFLEEGLVYDPARGENTYALEGDREAISRLLSAFQAGEWPESGE